MSQLRASAANRLAIALAAALVLAALVASPRARAQEAAANEAARAASPVAAPAAMPAAVASAASDGMPEVVERALGLIGIRYRRGSASVESGFDCSGLVGYVFSAVMGLTLPRTSYEIARLGTEVARGDLKPGDLVFFNTMQRSFSHVGIYLGDDKFLHAPRTGYRVRIEDMTGAYWVARFNGARRLESGR